MMRFVPQRFLWPYGPDKLLHCQTHHITRFTRARQIDGIDAIFQHQAFGLMGQGGFGGDRLFAHGPFRVGSIGMDFAALDSVGLHFAAAIGRSPR